MSLPRLMLALSFCLLRERCFADEAPPCCQVNQKAHADHTVAQLVSRSGPRCLQRCRGRSAFRHPAVQTLKLCRWRAIVWIPCFLS